MYKKSESNISVCCANRADNEKMSLVHYTCVHLSRTSVRKVPAETCHSYQCTILAVGAKVSTSFQIIILDVST